MKHVIATAEFAVLLILLGVIVSIILPGCATYRGMQSDVHAMTNPNWR